MNSSSIKVLRTVLPCQQQQLRHLISMSSELHKYYRVPPLILATVFCEKRKGKDVLL